MKMKPRSMQMSLREKDVHGNPYFERGRYAKKYTLHMYAKRNSVVHWDLADKHADTKEIERVAREAAEQMDGGETLIWDRLGRNGRASHPTSQHYSQKQKPPSRHVAWQPSSYRPKASTLIPSNSSSTIANHITSDRNFCEMVDICRSRKLKGSFESMWRRRHRLRCQASSVPVQMENMQLLTKCCNWVFYMKNNKGYLSIHRCTIYLYIVVLCNV